VKQSGSGPGLRWRLNQSFRSLHSFFLRITGHSKPDKDLHKIPPNTKESASIEGYTIKVNDREAMLINHLLTLHSYSPEYLQYLMKPTALQVRNQVGKIITQGAGNLQLLEEEIKWLLVIMPVSFPLGRTDAGFTLKKKLYEAYLKK
jgi:hypothetical protein